LQADYGDKYPAREFSQSIFTFQQLFSQIYDSLAKGPKSKSRISGELATETSFEFGFSYPGSLGVALIMPSAASLFGSKYDETVEAFLSVMEIDNEDDVRKTVSEMGKAVVSRAYNWSKANYSGNFGANVSWRTTSGTQRAGNISRNQFGRIVDIIGQTSDKEISRLETNGVLIGIDAKTNRFRFVEPSGSDYAGIVADSLDLSIDWAINTSYLATIEIEAVTKYATDKTNQSYKLVSLQQNA